MPKENPPRHRVTEMVPKGPAPAAAGHELVAGTRLDDSAVRKQLYEGGENAIRNSADTMIRLMRAIDVEARKYRTQYDDQVASVERIDGGAIGRLRFARAGFDASPDATF